MDMKIKNKKRFLLIISLLAVLLIMIVWILTQKQPPYVEYSTFILELEHNEIENVTIAGDKLIYQKIGDSKEYSTANPDYDTFKQELLLKGITVEETVPISIVDIIFDVICLGIIIFGIYKLTAAVSYPFKVVKHTHVHFCDIAGMEDIKKDALYAVDTLKNPEKCGKLGIRAVKGIILEGPPGNGKTFFAKALAEEAGVNFIAAKGADFQSMVMSVGSMRIKSLFKKARKHKPCIIFIDEFDGIGEKRSYAGTGIDKENNRMIVSMLNEMDGFSSGDGVLVIAATNSYRSLDPALVRPGRFDRKYHIGNPDFSTRKKLVELYTADKTVSLDINIDILAQMLDGFSCSAIETLLNEAFMDALNSGTGIVDAACMEKARRRTHL